MLNKIIAWSVNSNATLWSMWWIIIGSLLIFLIGFLLLAPLVITIESDSGILEIRFTGIARGNLIFDGKFRLKLRILGFNRQIDLGAQKKKISEQPKRESKKRRLALNVVARKSYALLKSFRITKFYFDVDSDNFMLNSWLYPAFHLADPAHRHWNINFNGRTSISFQVKNNLLRLLRAMLS